MDHELSVIYGRIDSSTDRLTPDNYKFLSDKEVIVEEYSTVAGSSRHSLESSFNAKKIKYLDAVSERSAKTEIHTDFKVTVTSYQSVLSNKPLTQNEVEKLCMRYRTAQKIKRCPLDYGVRMHDDDDAVRRS